MRWDRLFDDLEAQLAAQERLELDAEVSERTRIERSRVTLAERLAGSLGDRVSCVLMGGQRLEGVVADVGSGWCVLEESGRPSLVVLAGVVSVTGMARRPRTTAAVRRLELGYALRGVSRDRRVVHVHDLAGGLTTGTLDAVWGDAVDLSVHAQDEPRRAGNVSAVRTIPFAALAAVISAD